MGPDAPEFWSEMERSGPESVAVRGVELRRGSRVRLRPRPGGDVFDVALDGRTAVVEGLDQDDTGTVHVAVTIDDDPGRDLGAERLIAHRFFFRTDEIEPLEPAPRILVAGIGNIFLGDDAFGVEVAKRLSRRALPEGTKVLDFGIRGMDLALALSEYDAVVLVDTTQRGEAPGTLYLIDVAQDTLAPPAIATHGMDPARVLALARELGPLPRRTLVLGCEPARVPPPDSDEIVAELSAPVAAAVDVAVQRIEALLDEIREELRTEEE